MMQVQSPRQKKVSTVCGVRLLLHSMAEQKHDEEKYSLDFTVYGSNLEISVKDTETHKMYRTIFSPDDLRQAGCPLAPNANLQAIIQYIQSAHKGQQPCTFSIGVNTDDNVIVIKIQQMPIISITLKIANAVRSKVDILEDQLAELREELGNMRQHHQQEVQRLRTENGELRQIVEGLRREVSKMTWREFTGNAFDKSKEYRVRMNRGGGYYSVDYFDSRTLFFSCSTANHYYGCIEVTAPRRWHYRYKGNSAKKVPNGDNGNVHSIEERG